MSFKALVYEDDLEKMKQFVTHYPNIETGGDLFGLWQDDETVVIQFFIGPGKGSRRTTTSFYQDVNYLAKVGRMVIKDDGLCNVGEWHSHHQIGMPEPSSGDKSTVLKNMPRLGLQRFVLFIAHIKTPSQGKRKTRVDTKDVEIRCFMFKEGLSRDEQPVKGELKKLSRKNPFNKVQNYEIENGAERAPSGTGGMDIKRSREKPSDENRSPNPQYGGSTPAKDNRDYQRNKKPGGNRVSQQDITPHAGGLF